MNTMLQLFDWFQSLNTFAMIVVIGIVLWFLLKIGRLVSRIVSVAIALIGLAKVYLTLF